MNEDDFKEKFEALTEGMQLEKLYDQMADRADIARRVAQHAGEVYKAARASGLPRGLAAHLASSYWDSEMSPVSNTFIIGGQG